jgi:hypothetical protein
MPVSGLAALRRNMRVFSKRQGKYTVDKKHPIPGRSETAIASPALRYDSFVLSPAGFVSEFDLPELPMTVTPAFGVLKADEDGSWVASPFCTPFKYSRTGTFSLRQVSTTDRIAATFGPACGLPMCNQFFRPRATGRMEFSAKLVAKSASGGSPLHMAARYPCHRVMPRCGTPIKRAFRPKQ